MSISPKSPTTPASLGVLQLIVGMMTAGVVALLVISVVVHSADDSPKDRRRCRLCLTWRSHAQLPPWRHERLSLTS